MMAHLRAPAYRPYSMDAHGELRHRDGNVFGGRIFIPAKVAALLTAEKVKTGLLLQ